jgi:hypothetical protein
MKTRKNIIKNNYVFIWARRTDKIEESKLPDAKMYYNVLKTHNLLDEKIIIQTDDFNLFEDFKKLNLSFDYFEEIPFADKYSFHRHIYTIPDLEFLEHYKLSKEEYIRKMFCVVLLASEAENTILYPGNPTVVVPMYKNSFEKCILFKDNINII